MRTCNEKTYYKKSQRKWEQIMAYWDPFRCGEVIDWNYTEPTKYCNRKVKKEHSLCWQHTKLESDNK